MSWVHSRARTGQESSWRWGQPPTAYWIYVTPDGLFKTAVNGVEGGHYPTLQQAKTRLEAHIAKDEGL